MLSLTYNLHVKHHCMLRRKQIKPHHSSGEVTKNIILLISIITFSMVSFIILC
ncbi:uncharacterized protein DS421_13g436240 [Arachis hypogaea]|nr:uncharacterized protein DS421_13g436240 [Arachis hypogaea]